MAAQVLPGRRLEVAETGRASVVEDDVEEEQMLWNCHHLMADEMDDPEDVLMFADVFGIGGRSRKGRRVPLSMPLRANA